MINTCGPGQFGNKFFRNMVGLFISQNYKINCIYDNVDEFKLLGMDFNSNNIYPSSPKQGNIFLNDNNYMNYVKKMVPKVKHNIYLKTTFCQKHTLPNLILKYFNDENNKMRKSFMENNKFKERYNNNNDIFIHLRLHDLYTWGDMKNKKNKIPISTMTQWAHPTKSWGLPYFRSVLNKKNYEKGYIGTDSMDHPMVQTLASEYGLEILKYDKIDTILFGSTCNHIALSEGTFSWLIGALSINSDNIYYYDYNKVLLPNHFIKKYWYEPHMFLNTDWNKITLDI